MGLGANTAMKDAADLHKSLMNIAQDLSASKSITKLQRQEIFCKHMKKYNAIMVPRGVGVVRGSRRNTNMIHATGKDAKMRSFVLPVVSFIGNTVMGAYKYRYPIGCIAVVAAAVIVIVYYYK